ncbi:carboxypeptidase-like regulatory domain-containing protein [Ferruginibacter sp.]
MKAAVMISLFFGFSFTGTKKQLPAVELQGVIQDAATGLPVSNVYIYSVKGEEEAVTDKKGAFKIISWQSLPVSLTLSHKEYEEKKLQVSDAAKTILVKLKKR